MMSPRRAGPLSLLLALALLAPATPGRAAPAWKPLEVPAHVALYEQPAGEAAMFADLNAERAAAAEEPLRLDDGLSAVARAYARQMLEEGFIGHYSPDGSTPLGRLQHAGLTFTRMGENLSYTSGGEADAFLNLMNSPPHHRTMLDAGFTRVGIGAISVLLYGTMYVQEFSND